MHHKVMRCDIDASSSLQLMFGVDEDLVIAQRVTIWFRGVNEGSYQMELV